MSGRGRQARTNVLASNGDRQAKNRGSLITSTRSSSGSPSQRTRSLTPKVQETGGGVGGGVKPKKRVSNSSVTQSNPASSISNRRNSTERRKIRRPKFQDNPPGNVHILFIIKIEIRWVLLLLWFFPEIIVRFLFYCFSRQLSQNWKSPK